MLLYNKVTIRYISVLFETPFIIMLFKNIFKSMSTTESFIKMRTNE